jgi:5-enolpyruvylshikimate-3-phosphate synthase
VGISNKSGKFDMRISSSFVQTEMILRAYKKGSKSVTWSFSTNSDGQYRIMTSRALKGFTISLWIDGDKWDSLVVR